MQTAPRHLAFRSSLAISAGVHIAVGAALVGLPLFLSGRPPEPREPVVVAILPTRPAPLPREERREPEREIEQEPGEPLPEIVPVPTPEEQLDPSEFDPRAEVAEVPIVEPLDRVPAQAFRRPLPEEVARVEPTEAPPGRPEEASEPPSLEPPAPEVLAEVDPTAREGECPPPDYPPRAQRRGWEGVVVCLVTVAIDGSVSAVEIEESSGYRTLDEEVVATLERWRFEPGTRGGRPAEMQVRRRFVFQLTSP